MACATGRGPLQVLEGVSLGIGPGEVLGLVGESGSGKSTLAYAVMRAPVAAESGDILLGGVALRGLDENRLSAIRGNRVAMVFQHPGASLNPTLTLGEHFRQVLVRHRTIAPADVAGETERLLAMVGLPDPSLTARKYPHEVSGGENQRAVIALAFACEPELILFDEPTSALDATTAANVLDRQAPPPETRLGDRHLVACHLDAAALGRVPPIWQVKGGASAPFPWAGEAPGRGRASVSHPRDGGSAEAGKDGGGST